MSKECKARTAVLAELDFIHSMTHNLKEYVENEDWPKEVWEEKAKMLQGVQNTIVEFLKDVSEDEDDNDIIPNK
jgi:hypothetical protein